MKDIEKKSPQKLGILHIIISTIAAAFGVQSDRNREKDFKHGNIYVYIGAGIVFTIIFVVAVAAVVKIVLSQSGL